MKVSFKIFFHMKYYETFTEALENEDPLFSAAIYLLEVNNRNSKL